MSGSPSAVLWAGGISVFHQGGENDGSLWYDYFDGTNWYGNTLVPNLGISGSPSTVVYNGLLYVLHQGPNNDGQLWYSSNDGTNWTADTPGEREQRIALVLVFRGRKLVPRYAGSEPRHVGLTKLCSSVILPAQNPAELRSDHGQLNNFAGQSQPPCRPEPIDQSHIGQRPRHLASLAVSPGRAASRPVGPARPYPESVRISPATGNPIGNHRDHLAVGAKSFVQRGSLVAHCRF